MRGRIKGTGSLRERPPGSGRWQLRATFGVDPGTGKRRDKSWIFDAPSKKAADRIANNLLSEFEAGGVIGSRATVKTLLEEHLVQLEARGRSPRYLEETRKVIDNVLVPALGAIAIEDLSTHALDRMISKLTGRGLKPTSVKRYMSVLGSALNQAVKWEWIERSPMERVTFPAPKQEVVKAPSATDVARFISACQERSQVLGMFVLLSAVTGMRRGEVAALKWSDLDGELLNVRRSVYRTVGEKGTKSTKSGRERVVLLDPVILDRLQTWRGVCEKGAAEFETGPVSYSDDSYIFSMMPNGQQAVNIDTMSSLARKVADGLGLRELHLHSLRHLPPRPRQPDDDAEGLCARRQ